MTIQTQGNLSSGPTAGLVYYNAGYPTSTTSTITTTAGSGTQWINIGNVVPASGGTVSGFDYAKEWPGPATFSQWELERMIREKGGIPIWKKGASAKIKARYWLLTPEQEKENRELRRKGLPAKHRSQFRSEFPPGMEFELPRAATYPMPDGSLLRIDDQGNYKVEDKSAKVTYKANRFREFNACISASDLMAEFVSEIKDHPLVDQTNVLQLPIKAFINWLIRRAAERDEDSLEGLPTMESALPALPNPAKSAGVPRCVACGRYIKRAWAAAQIVFCSPQHMQLQLARLA